MPPLRPPTRITPTGVPLYLLPAADQAPAAPPAPAPSPAPAAAPALQEDEVVGDGAVRVLEELRTYITRSLRDYLAALPTLVAQYSQVGPMPPLPAAIDTLCEGTVPHYRKGARVQGAHAYLLLNLSGGTAMLSMPLGEGLVRAWEEALAAQKAQKPLPKTGPTAVDPEDTDEC